MKKIIISTFIFFLSTLVSFAQLSAGNKNYERLAYKKAAANYEKALRKDSTNMEVWSKLGDCYRLIRDPKNAERAYGHVVKGTSPNPESYLYYAEALMQNEKYDAAKAQIEKFKTLAPTDSRGSNLKEGIDNVASILAKSGGYNVKLTNLNSKEADFSPVVYNGGVVFTSNRKNVEWVDNSHSWTGKQFFRIYFAQGAEASFSSPTLFAGKLQTKYHDGPVSFNKNGNIMYFTRNNIEDGKKRTDDKQITRLKIYSTNYADGKWGIEVPMTFNNDNYSVAHPSLSADSKTLYFSSDMPGGQGGMDIWKTEWNGSAWGVPSNLGTTINTPGNEIFPFVAEDGTLLFSSDGLPGIGGLDLFQTSSSSGKWMKPENMGAPLNSSYDDFGVSFNVANRTGYFSSNRKNDGSNDDIYFFEKQCTNTDVTIIDEGTGAPLKDAVVKIMENGTEVGTVTTDESGKFNRCLNPLRNYEFIAMKDKYTENKSSLTSTQITEAASTGTSVKVALKKIPEVVNIANLIGRVFNQDDKTAVPNQTVTILNKTTGAELKVITDQNGNYKYDNLDLNCDYVVKTSKTDCGDATESFNTKNIVGTKSITMDLPMLCKGDIIRIDNIYYDYNKSNIRPDAAVELDKVVALLNKYPSMQIELRSHTDARGKDEYNAKLSDSRAKSAVEYIVSRGIAQSRLIAKGYGETQLLNKCKNGVECDDKTHEENRRTEFKILAM